MPSPDQFEEWQLELLCFSKPHVLGHLQGSTPAEKKLLRGIYLSQRAR